MLRRGPACDAYSALWASHCCRLFRSRNLVFHLIEGGESVAASGGGDHEGGDTLPASDEVEHQIAGAEQAAAM